MPAILDQFGQPLPTPTQRRMAAVRLQRRAELQAAYDAAAPNKEMQRHWRNADGLSAAEANDRATRETLRSRSRYEAQENNSFAKGICLTLANDVISTGPRLQIRTGNRNADRRIETAFRNWAKRVGLAKKLRTARLAKAIDGEAFVFRATNRRSESPVQLDLRLVEADQVETPGVYYAEPNRVSGVRFDDNGNPIKFDLLRAHPGSTQVGFADQADEIAASDVLHWFRCDRPGQVRGIPEITPALPLFAKLRRYTLAVILAAETAADFAAVLETQATAFDEDGNAEVDDVEAFDQVEIDRGMMVSVPRGWKMSQFRAEQPATTYREFRDAILLEIARCLHMPANKAKGDSSGYNYASGRLDHLTYYEAIDVERQDVEHDLLDRILGWWFTEARLIPGYLPQDLPPFLDQIDRRWYWPARKSADPTKDAGAAKTLHELGLLTDDDYLLEHGKDPEEHYDQLRSQLQRRKSIGFPAVGASSSGAGTNQSGGPPQAGGNPAQRGSSSSD